MQDAGQGLQKIINTRALILFDSNKNMYYLALMDGWTESKTFQGDCLMAKHDPQKDLDKVKEAALQADQNQVLGNPEQSLKEAFDTGGIDRDFRFTGIHAILGTNLSYVTNSG